MTSSAAASSATAAGTAHDHLAALGEVHQRLPLAALLKVLAVGAAAAVTAENLRLVALAVVLQAAAALAAAALDVLPLRRVAPRRRGGGGEGAAGSIARAAGSVAKVGDGGVGNLGVEGGGVAVQRQANRLLPRVLIGEVVAAADAVAVVAKLAVGEALAVQLQTLRAGAVARLPTTLLQGQKVVRVVGEGGRAGG